MLLPNNKLALAVKLAIGTAFVGTLFGCATPETRMRSEPVTKLKEEAVQQVSSENRGKQFGLKKIDSPSELPGGMVAKYEEGRGEISINASGTISSIIASVAPGHSVTFLSEVNKSKPVSVSIKGATLQSAVKQIALSAGYLAIIKGNNITIAETGAYTFRVPARLMVMNNSTYSVGGDPSNSTINQTSGSGGAGGGSGGAGGSSSGGGLTAAFVASNTSSAGKDVVAHIQAIAGTLASVSVSADTGHITVRGNAIALERVRAFLEDFVYDGNRRADVRVSVIEVTLNDANSYGIDWTKVLSQFSAAPTIGISGAAASVAAPSLAVNYTSASITSVINALKTSSDVKVLTQPNISAMNRIPAVIFDGSTIPYIGQITSSALQTNVTTTASASYATDGISLSLLADIVSDTEAQISLLPVLTGVANFQSFPIQGLGTIVAPTTVRKHALMTATVENGQTVILGGIRLDSEQRDKTKIPLTEIAVGADNKAKARELVILLQSNVIQPTRNQILVTESL